jgi:hypothetical protein
MDEWGPSNYGDPCRECDFAWTTPVPDAISLVANLLLAFRGILNGASGREQHPDLTW